MIDTLRRIIDRASTIRVLVVGDVMLDEYISGSATRISPEAPVPVVAVRRRHTLPGGAANVAANIAALGGRAALAGVTGNDTAAALLRESLQAADIVFDALVADPARPTTTKTRVTAGGQQIVRFDHEDTSDLGDEARSALETSTLRLLDSADAVVLSDYAKGVLSVDFCQTLIRAAIARALPVVVDPKSKDFTRYRGATVITPNLKEANAVADHPAAILSAIAPSALLITRGDDGMSLHQQGHADFRIPAAVNEVADVTGAGDTVVGVLAVALGVGLDLREAAAIANFAAGIAVGHHGTWAVTTQELLIAASRL